MNKTIGIECALWPNLYPYTTLCKSVLSGKESRLSGKILFHTKLFSEIIDYALHFDLLQFQYDRAMYKSLVTLLIRVGLQIAHQPAHLTRKHFHQLIGSGNTDTSLMLLHNSICLMSL